MVNLHNFLHNKPEFQQKLISFILEKFLTKDGSSGYPEIINRCKDTFLELILLCIEAKHEPAFYISLYVTIYNFFLSKEELPFFNNQKIINQANKIMKKSSNLPHEFIRLAFYLNYINPVYSEDSNVCLESDMLKALPNTVSAF